MTLAAAPMARSTASRRSSEIALSRSEAMSRRARSTTASCSARTLSTAATRSFSSAPLASASIDWAEARASAWSFSAEATAALASVFKRSASASWALILFSRSIVDLRIPGQANFQSTKSRIPKTNQVQKKSPKFTSKGDVGPAEAACSPSCNASNSASFMCLLCLLASLPPCPRLLDQLEQQRKHHRDDRRAFEQHREQQRRTADLAAGFGLPGDRLGRLAADPAQADPGPDDGQPDADAGAEQGVVVEGRFRRHRLEQGEQVEHQHVAVPVARGE